MAALAPVLRQRFFDSNGDPLSGGKLYAYAAGTTTFQDTYQDQAGSALNANPIILDADGEADVWISEAGYKFRLDDSNDVPQWTVDNVYSSAYAQATSADLIDNLSIACSVAANQLTISLKDAAGADPSVASSVKVGIRSATLLNGVITKLVISAPLTLTISSGSTLGHTSAQESPIFVGILNNSGVGELCACTVGFDEKVLITTVAEGGAGTADNPSVIYSNTARSNVPVRNIGRLSSTQTTAGTWAAVPTNIAVGDQGKLLSMPFPLPTFGGSNLNYPSNQVVKTGLYAGSYAWAQANFGEYGAFSSTIAVDPVYGYCSVTAPSGAVTLTLPTAVGRNGKTIVFKKTDSQVANVITIDGFSTETIDGALTTTLNTQYECLTIYSDGANWQIIERKTKTPWASYTPTFAGLGTVTITDAFWRRDGANIFIRGRIALGTTTAATATMTLPNSWTTTGFTASQSYIGAFTNTTGPFNATVMSIITANAVNTLGFGVEAGGLLVAAIGTSVGASGNVCSFYTSAIPITGWND
jgi:hypothetical protein